MRKFLFLLFCLFGLPLAYGQSSPFHVLPSKEPIALSPGGKGYTTITVQMPDKYFIYRDKTELKFLDAPGIRVEKIQYPPSKTKEDPFFKKKLEVFEGTFPVLITVRADDPLPPLKNLQAVLKFQGCSDVLCYPEETQLVSFPLEIDKASAASAETFAVTPKLSLMELIRTQDFAPVMEQGLWMVLLVVFLGGVLTSFTPCVLPVIPLTLLVIGVRPKESFRHNLFHSLLLVLGLSLTYAVLGLLAVSLGKSLGFVFQQKWFVVFLSAFFLFLSLSMFGHFELRLPQTLVHKLSRVEGRGFWGSLASGMVVGILAAPCAGPVIGALLLFVAQGQNYFKGFYLLWVYALGMGLLFLIIGVGFSSLKARLKAGRWTLVVKKIFGVFLLLVSLFYLNTVISLDKVLSRWTQGPSPIVWLDSESQGLETAARTKKWMLIDFYADWCSPCKELEYGFFRRPEVVALLKQMVAVRVDATFTGKPEVQAVLKKYGVVGWPTILFVDKEGNVAKELSVVSYDPEKLLKNMEQVVYGRGVEKSSEE